MTFKTLTSKVTPAYKSTDCLTDLHKRLCDTLKKIGNEFEILMVKEGIRASFIISNDIHFNILKK